MMIERRVAVCVFYGPEAARDAVVALREAGFPADDISLIAPDTAPVAVSEGAKESSKKEKAREGAITGAVAGGLFGGLAGWLVGLGTFAIPGVGPLVAAGALAGVIGGAAVGAGLGAIAGALVGMGVPEDEAKYYENEVRGGRSLIAVRDGGRADEADRIMHRHGGYDVQHRDQSSAPSSPARGQP
jgi:uncharacterized membrane protein